MSVIGIFAILLLTAALIGGPLLIANIRAIFCREVNSFFTSPLAYVLMFIFLVAVNALTFLWPGRELVESEQAALKDFFFFYIALQCVVGQLCYRAPIQCDRFYTMQFFFC